MEQRLCQGSRARATVGGVNVRAANVAAALYKSFCKM